MSDDDLENDEPIEGEFVKDEEKHNAASGFSAVVPSSVMGNTSIASAWVERHRLAAIERTVQEQNKIVRATVDLNESIGELHESEIYKQASIDALNDLPTYLKAQKEARAKEYDAQTRRYELDELEDKDARLELEISTLEKQKILDKLKASGGEEKKQESPAADDEKDIALFKKYEAREAEIIKGFDEQRVAAKEAGTLTEAFSKQLDAMQATCIHALEIEIFNESKNG